MADSSNPKLTRRRLLGVAVVSVTGAAVATPVSQAQAFFNAGAFWKKPTSATSSFTSAIGGAPIGAMAIGG